MRSWTHILGTVRAIARGRTQAECSYFMETVLSHLPRIEGSEGGMQAYLVRCDGHNSSDSVDELDNHSNLGDPYFGTFNTQTEYLITLNGHLRDTYIEETYRELVRWVYRLAKRVAVQSVMVSATDGTHTYQIPEYDAWWTVYESGNRDWWDWYISKTYTHAE